MKKVQDSLNPCRTKGDLVHHYRKPSDPRKNFLQERVWVSAIKLSVPCPHNRVCFTSSVLLRFLKGSNSFLGDILYLWYDFFEV